MEVGIVKKKKEKQPRDWMRAATAALSKKKGKVSRNQSQRRCCEKLKPEEKHKCPPHRTCGSTAPWRTGRLGDKVQFFFRQAFPSISVAMSWGE